MDQQQQHDMMMTYQQQQQLQMLQQQQMIQPAQQQQSQQQYIQGVSQAPVPPSVPAGVPFYGQQQQPVMVSLGGVYHFIDDANINPSTNTNYYSTVMDSNNNTSFGNSNIQMNHQSGGGRVATAPGTTMVMMMPSPAPLQQQQQQQHVFPANRSRAVSTGSLLLPQASPMQQQQLHFPYQQQQQQQGQHPVMLMPSQQQTFTPTGTNSSSYIGATQPPSTSSPSLQSGSTANLPTLPNVPFLVPPPVPATTGDSPNIAQDFNQQQQNQNDGIERSVGQAFTTSSSTISTPHQLPPKPVQPKLQRQESATADTTTNIDNTNIGSVDSPGIIQLHQQQQIKDQHEMDIARRKLELLQEKVEVDQELLKQDKRNFKRRFKAAKLAIQKSQESIQESIRQDEEMKRQQLTHQYENQIKEIKKKTERMKSDQKKVIQELQEQVQKLEQEVVIRAKEEEERIQEILKKQKLGRGHERNSMRSSFRDSIASKSNALASNNGQQSGEDVSEHDQLNNKLQQLQQIVDDQQMTIDSYEMQLLELERTNDTDGLNGSANALGTDSSGKHDVDNITFGVPGKRNERLLRESQAKIDALKSRLQAAETKYKEQVNVSKSLQDQLRKQEEEIQLQVHASGLNEQKKKIQSQYEALVKDMDQMKIKHSNSLNACEQRMQNEINELNRRNESLLKQLEDQRKQYQSAMNSYMAQGGSKHTNTNTRKSSPSNSGAGNAGESPNVVIPDPTIHIQVYEYEWESDKSNKGTSLTGTYTGWINKETKNPDGNGTLRVDDGTISDGDWYNGQFHGTGVYATIDGDLYTGQWSLGKRSGHGVQVWSDGRVYRGPFVNDKRHGDDGTMTWPYGAYYTGQFQNNKRNGYGCYRYADGRYYIGNYQDERPHGYGVLWKSKPSDTTNIHDPSSISKMSKNDILYDGQWQLGEFIGPEDSKSQNS